MSRKKAAPKSANILDNYPTARDGKTGDIDEMAAGAADFANDLFSGAQTVPSPPAEKRARSKRGKPEKERDQELDLATALEKMI